MSDQTEKKIEATTPTPEQAAAPAAPVEPKISLKPGLFQNFTLGSTLKQSVNGNVMSNVKPNMMDYDKVLKESSKNVQLTPEQLTTDVKKAAFKEVSSAIQRKEGYSKKRADAIAAAAGRKELGEEEMECRAKKGHKKAEEKK